MTTNNYRPSYLSQKGGLLKMSWVSGVGLNIKVRFGMLLSFTVVIVAMIFFQLATIKTKKDLEEKLENCKAMGVTQIDECLNTIT